jgi:hypothetical protein
MDEFHRLFEIDHKHRILICLSCQYAVVPFQIKTHLQTYHKRINLQQRNYIIAEIEATTELARTYAEVIYPVSTDPLIASLPTFLDGLRVSRERRPKRCLLICMSYATRDT